MKTTISNPVFEFDNIEEFNNFNEWCESEVYSINANSEGLYTEVFSTFSLDELRDILSRDWNKKRYRVEIDTNSTIPSSLENLKILISTDKNVIINGIRKALISEVNIAIASEKSSVYIDTDNKNYFRLETVSKDGTEKSVIRLYIKTTF